MFIVFYTHFEHSYLNGYKSTHLLSLSNISKLKGEVNQLAYTWQWGGGRAVEWLWQSCIVNANLHWFCPLGNSLSGFGWSQLAYTMVIFLYLSLSTSFALCCRDTDTSMGTIWVWGYDILKKIRVWHVWDTAIN